MNPVIMFANFYIDLFSLQSSDAIGIAGLAGVISTMIVCILIALPITLAVMTHYNDRIEG